MMLTTRNMILLLLALGMAIVACKKDEETIINPYDNPANDPPPSGGGPGPLNPSSIQGLHQNIFSTKCANAGCHDGAFEPDFRSVESTYNTLVYHRNSQKGDSLGFTYRVVPGDTTNSFLHERITIDVNNPPGSLNYGEAIMPLYSTLTAAEISQIETWILNGAKDIFDSSSVIPNEEPMMLGVVAFKSGNITPLGRDVNNGPILSPASYTSVDIWFSLIDDKTDPSAFTYNMIKFSAKKDDFTNSPELPLILAASPITEAGYYGNPPGYFPNQVEFTHMITINPNVYSSGEVIYMHIFVQDADHTTPTEIPEMASRNLFKQYFAFQVN